MGGSGNVENLESFDIAIVEVPKTKTLTLMKEVQKSPFLTAAEKDFKTNWIKDVDAAPSLSSSFQQAQGIVNSAKINWPWKFPKPQQPSASSEFQWNMLRIDAPKAWKKTQGKGVNVAIIDTGVDCSHPDLNCSLSDGVNIINPATSPMDDNEHGTHVAGIISGQGQTITVDGQKTRVFGVAPQVHIIPVKALDAKGSGYLSDIVLGIYWATSHGAQVINMSLGSPSGATSLEQAVQKAYQAGVTVIAAAGNDGQGNQSTVNYPGAYPWVIAVAASDSKDHIASFSSAGPAVDLITPGVDILSTIPTGYERMSGTSMACPHAVGLAALAIASGASSPEAVKKALNSASKRLCSKKFHQFCLRYPPATDQGHGLPDAAKIVGL